MSQAWGNSQRHCVPQIYTPSYNEKYALELQSKREKRTPKWRAFGFAHRSKRSIKGRANFANPCWEVRETKGRTPAQSVSLIQVSGAI